MITKTDKFHFNVGPFEYQFVAQVFMGTCYPEGGNLSLHLILMHVESTDTVRPGWSGASRPSPWTGRGYGLGTDARYTFRTLATVIKMVRELIEKYHPGEIRFSVLDASHDRFWGKLLRRVLPGCPVEKGKYGTEPHYWTVSLGPYGQDSRVGSGT